MLRRLLPSLAIAVALFVVYQWATWPDVAAVARSDPASSAFIERHRRQSNGRTFHSWVPYPEISDSLKHAVLVAEDIGFFSHRGFAIDEIRLAVRESLEDGRKLRGASSITQQVAKNLWLSPSRSPWRKVKEILLTRQLERRLSKQRILEIYLNVAQFGPDVFGAEAAARTFFGTSAGRLDENQAAALAAGLSRPGSWNPDTDSKGYRDRVTLIRGRMRRAHWLRKHI